MESETVLFFYYSGLSTWIMNLHKIDNYIDIVYQTQYSDYSDCCC